MWKLYVLGSWGLISCSLTTFATIRLASRLQFQWEEDSECAFDYWHWAFGFYSTACKKHGLDASNPDSYNLFTKEVHEVGEMLMMPVFEYLKHFNDSVMKVGKLPRGLPGSWANYNPLANRDKMSGHDKFMEDKDLMDTMMEDFLLLADNGDGDALLTEDDLILMARGMIQEDRTTHLWGVLALQLFLDIHHALREKTNHCFEELRGTAANVKQTLAKHSEFLEDVPSSNVSPDYNEGHDILVDVIERYVETDIVARLLPYCVSSIPHVQQSSYAYHRQDWGRAGLDKKLIPPKFLLHAR